MAFEDFTTYSGSDPGAVTTITSSTFSWDDLDRSTNTSFSKNKGVGHFNKDFNHQFIVQASDRTLSGQAFHYGLSTKTGKFEDQVILGMDAFLIQLANNVIVTLYEGGSFVDVDTFSYISGVTYYITAIRDYDGGSGGNGLYTIYIRTGSHEGTLVDTLVVESDNPKDYQYVLPLMVQGSGSGTIDGFIQNLQLEIPPNKNFGLKCWDSNGNVTLDLTDKISRLRFTTTVSAAEVGSIKLPDIGGRKTVQYAVSLAIPNATLAASSIPQGFGTHYVGRLDINATVIKWRPDPTPHKPCATSAIYVFLYT